MTHEAAELFEAYRELDEADRALVRSASRGQRCPIRVP